MKCITIGLTLSALTLGMADCPGTASAQQEPPLAPYSGPTPRIAGDAESRAKQNEALKLALAGRKLFRAGDVDGAMQAHRKALDIDPNGAGGVAIVGLAHCYMARGRYREAIEGYRFIVRPGPEIEWVTSLSNEPEVLLNYALALLRTGQREEAIAMYEKGVRNIGESNAPLQGIRFSLLAFNPRLFEAAALVGIGISHRQHGYYDEAMARYQEAVRMKVDFAPVYLEMGDALWIGKGRKEEGRAMYEQAIRFDRGAVAAKAKKRLSQ